MLETAAYSPDVTSLTNRQANDRWNRVSIGDMFERVRWSYPDREAVVASEDASAYPEFRRMTYTQADELANKLANSLLAQGLERADRVVLLCENTAEAYIAQFGIVKAGLVCAPMNPRLPPDMLDYLLGLLDAKFAIVDAEFWERSAETFARRGIGGAIIPINGSVTAENWVDFRDFVKDSPATEPEVTIHGDDIWQILPTSGTTAMPKGVMISHHATYLSSYSHALTQSRGLRFESDIRTCCLLPLIYHAPFQTQSLPALLCGGTVIIGRQAKPRNFAELVTAESPTHLWGGSPQFLADMLAEVDGDPAMNISSLRSIVFTWAALPMTTAARLKVLCGEDLSLVAILGQTEASPCTRFSVDKHREIYENNTENRNIGGLAPPILAAAIMAEDGSLIGRASPETPGEIVYRTPALASGYYKNPEATVEAFRFGWFHSGDCCCYDENGLVIMLDRYKDVVKSGGENVSTIRVEGIVTSHPKVHRAAIVGLPHDRWSEAVTGFVIPKPGVDLTEAELLAYSRDRLAGFEAPKGFVIVDSLPESIGGKVLKYVLRDKHRDFYTGRS